MDGRALVEVLMHATEGIEGVVLSDRAPAEVRAFVADLLEGCRRDGTPLDADTAFRAVLLASELIADAFDHGSDAATVRVGLDDGTLRVEVFDGPRRSVIGIRGREDDVATYRNLVLARFADSWSSGDLGDGHFARCEIRCA
jgi:hypothetical protein